MTRAILSMMVLASAGLGCVEMTYGSPEVKDTVLNVERKTDPGDGIAGEIKQSGTMVSVNASKKCDLTEVKEVRRTTTKSKKNDYLGLELGLIAAATGPIGSGALFLVDAQSVYPSDRDSRLYNSSGPEASYAVGIILITVGAAVMALPLVDVLRTIGDEEEETTIKEAPTILQKDVGCRGFIPPSGFPVSGRLPNGQQISLGNLDGRGELSVDLASAIPTNMLAGPNPPTKMSVWINQTQIGTVTLAPVAFAQAAELIEREEAAWRALDLAQCREGRVDNACAAVQAFLAAHPAGNHAAEAKRMIDHYASRPKGPQIAADPNAIKAEAEKKKADEAAKKKADEAARKKAEADAAAAKKKAEADAAAAVKAAQAAAAARDAAAKAAKAAAAQACKNQCAATCNHEKLCTTKCAQEACQ
jgi:hypothetical protein